MAELQNNRAIAVIIRAFVSLSIVVFGVFRHLYGLEEGVGGLLESGLAQSSIMALIEIHVITVLELVVVVWTIGFKINRSYLILTGLLFVLYSLSYFLSLKNESFVGVDLSSVNGIVGYPLALFAVLLVVYSYLKLDGLKRWLPSWSAIVISLALVIGYIAYYSGTIIQYSNQGNEYNVAYAKWNRYWEAVESQQPEFAEYSKYTICFFSTSCSHCNQAAKRIGVYRRKFPEKKILVVFFGKSADGEFWETGNAVKEFLNRNNLDISYVKMVDYEAISISDNRFPVMIEMEEKKPRSIYIGEEVNAWAFDYLFKTH